MDVEMIAYATTILKALKIKDVTVRVNSIGDEESRELYKDALLNHLKDDVQELCHDCQVRYTTNPLRILDCKVDKDHPLLQSAPKPIDYLNDVSKAHFDQVIDFLDGLGLDYKIDPNLVRGLDYYTHTVFELDANLPTLGAQNTICAGGRYNDLVKSLDGPEKPGVGFAFGLERLLFALKSSAFKVKEYPLHLYLMILGDNQKQDGLKMLNRCRMGGLRVDIDYLDRSMKAKWKEAARYNAQYVAIYGDAEKENGEITVKDQDTGEQTTISKHDLYDYVLKQVTK
jgi:histidyl-tRNA synthetase